MKVEKMKLNDINMQQYKGQMNVRRTVTSEKLDYSEVGVLVDSDRRKPI